MKKAVLDVGKMPNGDYVFHAVFLDTGEIRQKRRSKAWLAQRVFRDELKTWAKRGEVVEFEEEDR